MKSHRPNSRPHADKRSNSASGPALAEHAIDVNRTLLNRYRYIEQSTLLTLAGWLPRIATFELKCEAGRMIWESSLHVNAFYLRLREIQSPAFQKPNDPTLLRLMEEMPHAPDEFALMLAYCHVLLPSLIQALEDHERATFPNSDLPSVYAIRHALLDLRATANRVEPLLAQAKDAGKITPAASAWQSYVRQLLQATGGANGLNATGPRTVPRPECYRTFMVPREAARDDRFSECGSGHTAMPDEEAYERHTVEEFRRYSTEMLAAETVAVVMYSLPDVSWEFTFDCARHLYDEVRHCLMGYEWMRRHDLDPYTAPQFLPVFKWRSQFPPVMQYCLLTMGNEVNAFPYRHRRVTAHQASGDKLSEQFVRYDIADETQHVRFGKRWLPELLRHVGEPRTPEQYIADVLQVWETQYRSGKLTINVE